MRALNFQSSWSDNTLSSFFQMGQGSAIFSGSTGTVLNRFGITSSGTEISDAAYNTLPAPAGLLDVYSATPGHILVVKNTGLVGIGTSSPFATLSVNGNGFITGTFTTANINATGTLAVAGNTTLAQATSTTFAITNISSGFLLKTATGGAIVPAVAGTDYLTSANASPYPFYAAGNATTTLTQFNGGLTAYASSTIGNGTAAGGLTISGNSTTTGTAYFAGYVGIGTSTPQKQLQVENAQGDFAYTADSNANYLQFGNGSFNGAKDVQFTSPNVGITYLTLKSNGNVGVGTTSPYKTFSVGGDVVVGAATAGGTLGNLYLPSVANQSCLGTDAAGKVQAGTCSGGSAYPFFVIGNATTTLTQFNGGLTAFASSTIGNGTAAGGLTVSGMSTTTGTAYFAGTVGIGDNTPDFKLESVGSSGNGYFGITNSSDGDIFNINSGGNVGIGTNSQNAKLEIRQDGSSMETQLVLRNNNGANGSTGSRLGFGVYRDIDPTALGASIDAINTLGLPNGDNAQGATLVFNTTKDGTSGLQERMRILNTGQVGIGTTNPQATLDVQGTASSTNLNVAGTATTTNLVVTSAAGTPGCATFGSTGLLSNTGIACGAGGGGSPFPFTPTTLGNATGTLLQLGGGFIASASSTVVGGLTTADLSTLTSGNYTSLNNSLVVTPASASSGNFWGQQVSNTYGSGSGNDLSGGIHGAEYVATNAWTATVANAFGLTGQAYNASTGIITNAIGIYGYAHNGSTGTIGTAKGGVFEVLNPSGTVNTGYGIYIGNVQATTKYSVYASDATAPSYFAGKVGVGTTTPFGLLSINPTASLGTAPAFVIGSSTNTLFTVSNTGSTTIGNFGACSGSNALTTNANGTIICGAVSGGGGSSFPFVSGVFGSTVVNATSTALQLTGGLFASSTVRFGNAGISPFLFNGATGNLGLGTTSPFAKLSVQANYGDTAGILFAIGSSTAPDGSTNNSLFSVDDTGLTTIGNPGGTGDAKIPDRQ